jgi:hypothetical protein
MRILGYQQITSLSAATALTIPAGTGKVILRPATQAVRFRSDGTNPTASVGFPIPVGEKFELEISSLPAFRVIEQTASATLEVLYLGD